RQPIPVNTGESVTVTYLAGDSIGSFESKIMDRRDREMDLALPRDNVAEEKTPDPKSDFTLEIPIPVEYRAMSMGHVQTAVTKAITSNGIHILTNVQVPIGTLLHVELEIPNSPAIKTKGKVLKSQKLSGDSKKNLTELEFEDITSEDKGAMLRYAIFYQQRQLRKQRLQPPAAPH
ncbi:MAG: PilZ domain-containing protein, partial [Candidatus Xenobia bacterium]